MAYFSVNLLNLRRAATELNKVVNQLEQMAGELGNIAGSSVYYSSGSFARIRSKIKTAQSHTSSVAKKARSLRSALNDIISIYEKTENAILGNKGVSGVAGSIAAAASIALSGGLLGLTKNSCLSGDPVDLATGNYVYEKRLLALEGISEFELVLFYNSMKEEKGIFGKGWTSNLEWRVESAGENILYLYTGDGAKVTYERMEDGLFVALRCEGGTITQTENGYLYFDDQRHMVFGNSGYIRLLADINANGMVFEYDENYRLTHLSTTSDVNLTCEWEDNNLVSIHDGAQKSVGFEYNSDQFCAVTDEAGYKTTFTYNSQILLSELVSHEGIVVLKNTYDAKNRVIRQEFPDGGTNLFEFDDENRQVTYTEANGNRVVYVMDEKYNNIETRYTNGTQKTKYNSRGQKTAICDKRGNTTYFDYDGAGNLTLMKNPLGDKVETTYDRNRQPLTISVNNKKVYDMKYDDSGNALSYKDMDGRGESYEYNERGQITKLYEMDGSCLQAQYDSKGNMIWLKTASGVQTWYEYDAYNRVIATVDGNGNRTEYTYYPDNCIRSVKNPLGQECFYTYDSKGNVTEFIHFDGTCDKIEYNSINKPSKYTDAAGNETFYEYDKMWNMVRHVAANQAVTQYGYDAYGQLISITDALGHTSTCERDANGNIITRISAAGEIYKLEYDALNRPVKMINPDDTFMYAEYDALGRTTSMTDAQGNISSWKYNFNGDVISETDAKGYRKDMSYDTMGNLVEIKDDIHWLKRFEYYPGGTLKAEYQADGSSMSYTYDANGNIATQTNQEGYTLTYSYDCMDREICVRGDDGFEERYEYDAEGRRTAVIDAYGNKTSYEYDAVGNVVSVTDASGFVQNYEYDSMRRLIKNPKEIIRRNLLGQITRIEDVAGNITQYGYDANNRMSETIDADGFLTKFEYEYDGLPKSLLYADGRSVMMQYDALRNLAKVQDWNGITTFEKNAVGDLLSVTHPNGDSVNYLYNERGQQVMMVYPDGRQLRSTYNEKAQLTRMAMEDTFVEYSYDENGMLKRKAFSNGAAHTYAFLPSGVIKNICQQYADGQSETREYTFNYNWQNIGMKVTSNAGVNTYDYAYTALGDLAKVLKNGVVTEAYDYDSFGNRTKAIVCGEEHRYCYNALNQLIEGNFGPDYHRFEYDKRGNRVAHYKNRQLLEKYDFGAANQMDKVVTSNGSAVYTYNGVGQRMCQTFYDAQTQKIDNVNIIRDYSEGVNGKIIQLQNSKQKQCFAWDEELLFNCNDSGTWIYGCDAIGSPVYGSNNKDSWKIDYDTFGNVCLENTQQMPLGFTGYLKDEFTGLYHAGQRDYDSVAGRFTSKDPIRGSHLLPRYLNPYLYCFNDPLGTTDPDGQWIHVVVGGLIGAAVNVGAKVVTNAVTGKKTTWQEVTGAAVGGFTEGAVLAGTGNPLAASVAGSAVENTVTHVATKLSGDTDDSWGEVVKNIVVDTTVDVAAGVIVDKTFGKIGKAIGDTKVGKYVKNTKAGKWIGKQLGKIGQSGKAQWVKLTKGSSKNFKLKTIGKMLLYKGGSMLGELGYKETVKKGVNKAIEWVQENFKPRRIMPIGIGPVTMTSLMGVIRGNTSASCPLAL